jgi:hypothetical protein
MLCVHRFGVSVCDLAHLKLNLLQETTQLAQSEQDKIGQTSFWEVSTQQVSRSPNEFLPSGPLFGT